MNKERSRSPMRINTVHYEPTFFIKQTKRTRPHNTYSKISRAKKK
jgi:hypothetical protein